VTSFVDLVDPRLTGTTAFTVRDGLLVPLRPRGWHETVESHEVGEVFGREAKPTDRLAMPWGDLLRWRASACRESTRLAIGASFRARRGALKTGQTKIDCSSVGQAR
jgi:hypothetical protein